MIKKYLRYLVSIQFFIVTLTLLGIVSVIGIVIPQGWEHPQYLQKFGKGLAFFIIKSGWNQIFASLWFIIPLAAFMANLIFCVYSRIISLITILRQKPLDTSLLQEHESAKKLHYSDTTLENIRNQLEDSLAKNRYSFRKKVEPEAVTITAQKGRIGLTGSMLLHAGLVVLIAGGVIQYYFGDYTQTILSKGKLIPIKKYGIQVRMNNFEIVSNEKGDLLNYATALEILDNDSTVLLSDTTKVNAPLKYRNFYFYQVHYGYDPHTIKQFHAIIIDTVTKDTVFNVAIPFNRKVSLGKADVYLLCDAFLCDFVFDMSTRKPLNRSHEHKNPAFRITMFKNDSLINSQWIFLNFPVPHGSHGQYNCKIISYSPAFFSGIEIRKKPGTTIIWLGILVVSIGIILVFTFPFRQILLVCKEEQGTIHILLAPDKKHAPDWFEEETDTILTSMKAGS